MVVGASLDLYGSHVLVLHGLLAVVERLEHSVLARTRLLGRSKEVVLKHRSLVHLIAYQFAAWPSRLRCHVLDEARLSFAHLVGG